MTHKLKKHIVDEDAMLTFGAQLAQQTSPPAVIYLQGHLGVGKTTLVRGFVRALGFAGFVKSPSYSLLEVYDLNGTRVIHLDLYRLQQPLELHSLGLSDYLTEDAILLIEWPEKALDLLPKADHHYCIELLDNNQRILKEIS